MNNFELNSNPKFSFTVIDDFYRDPVSVRDYALSLDYQADNRYFKGKRSTDRYFSDEIGRKFEIALQRRITKWDYDVNGCFQYCTSEDPIVYHMDSQQYAAIIFLSANAPYKCGTSFFASNTLGFQRCPSRYGVNEKGTKEFIDEIFSGGFYDGTKFQEVDRVGNVFNRCVIWDAKMIHAATQYYGTKKDDSRLFQIFFFDAVKDE